MLSPTRGLLPVALVAAVAFTWLPAGRADDRDPLQDAQARMKVEAQRVEKAFADGRSAAYKLVRRDNPDLLSATEKLHTLLAMVRADTSLEPKRREVLIVTLKADLERVAQIAAERRRAARALEGAVLGRAIRSDASKADSERRAEERRELARDARSILDSRGRAVADARSDRIVSGDRFNRVMRSVDESAIPESRPYVLPKDWVEKSKKRSLAMKMTAKERAIMTALSSSLTAEFSNSKFQEVIDYLERTMKVTIAVDKRALDEVSVSYETPINLRLRASGRSVLKRVLGDLGLTYIVKDETIQITSPERAKELTTVRTYYIGDIVSIADIRVPPAFTQAAMIDNVNRLISNILQNVDPQSWKINNPDAVGTIVFDPLTMSLAVRQSAEIHFMMGGGFR